ncbi:hypothetical protein GYA37_03725 [candidate division WWE3 bacterium]|uniref:Lipoprotein n=1 Tax=candidate division WWE3 bacterium TaxID=2053526 RepID=A0A7X9E7Q2_UNCKA|nr:hypothetical protein [candidate division WWE3 bacterium]
MKKILAFILLSAMVSGCASTTVTSVLNNVATSEKQPLSPEVDNALTTACAATIGRIAADRVEETLPLCVNRVREFFEYHDQLWLDSDEIYFVSLDVVRLWSDARIKTYAEAYGCQNGCVIQFDNFPAAKILDVLQEEMVEMGNNLRSKGYVVPIYEK